MANGRDLQLARQIGEHLVAAELGRKGYVATPFAGNVPLFDLLAADMAGRAFSVQVKTVRGLHWQIQAEKLLNIDIDSEGKQHVISRVELLNPDLICIFVMLKSDSPDGQTKDDEFYILPICRLQDIVEAGYQARLKVCNPRPKNPTSTHHTVSRDELKGFRDNWRILESVRTE